MHERRATLERTREVDGGRQILVLHVDRRDGFLCDLRIRGGDHRDFLANEAHAIPSEERHVEHPPPDEHVRHVGRRQHGQHAGQRPRPRGVDPQNPRVRQRAAQRLAPDQAGERYVR